MSWLAVTLFLLLCGILECSRIKTPSSSDVRHPEPLSPVEDLKKFKVAEQQYDLDDEKAGRKRTEVKKMMVYKVQPTFLPFLSDSNAADLMGELKFLAKDMPLRNLKKSGEYIVQHEVEIEVATNPHRAYHHYLRYIGGRPDRDPRTYGIDTVGWKMREHGGEGWLSFPSELACGSSDTVGENCAWKDLRRVKTIHSTCLLGLIDDGVQANNVPNSMKSFEEVLKRFEAPGAEDTFLDFNQKVAIRLFERALNECPDAGVLDIIPYTGNVRRCCCFNEYADKQPPWISKGVCLKGNRNRKIMGRMWSMKRAKISSEKKRCAEGYSLYTLDTSRGRCLTIHDNTWNSSMAIDASGDPLYRYEVQTPEYNFEQMRPSLVRSNLWYLGAGYWKENLAYVCPSTLGMHNKGCDCSWAHEVC